MYSLLLKFVIATNKIYTIFFLEQICILVNIFSAANLREVFWLIIEKNSSQENVMCDFLEDIVFSFETFRISDESSIITACSRFSAQWL